MRLAVRLCSLALVFLASSLAAADEPKRWALCVGVDDYVSFVDLKYSGRDAVALAGALRSAGFDERRVFTLHDAATDAALRPTKSNIERQLAAVLSLAGKDDLVIVSFSGHGVHLDGKSYLCPTEADDRRHEESMIEVAEVYRQFEKCGAAMKLMLVDACRNDPRPAGRRSATPAGDRQALGATFARPPDGIIVLQSCSEEQISWEDENLKQGVFMHFVLKGISGDADGNKNGRVTISELYDFAADETKLFVANRFPGEIQIPALSGKINGVFELPRGGLASAEKTRLGATSIGPPPVGSTTNVPPPIGAGMNVPPPIGSPKPKANSVGMKFVLIPAGEFEMGARPLDAAYDYERPSHRVKITRPFYLGTTEVTQSQWEAVMGRGPWSGKLASKKDPNLPATEVSWDDAVEFCRKLSEKESGASYRLPTEAEWEYACRAGTTSTFYFGDDKAQLSDHIIWGAFKGGNSRGLFPELIATKPANAWGLFDMLGNTEEWCSDWYSATYYTESPATDPRGPQAGTDRVCRGGNFTDDHFLCRSASRNNRPPESKKYYVGFRVALDP